MDTLKEVRALLKEADIAAPEHAFIDMHDLGDMLTNRFYDPVMDVESQVFAYTRPERLLADLELTGLWRALVRHPADEMRARAVAAEAVRSGSLKEVTMEWVFGHALARPHVPADAQPLAFHQRTHKQ